MSDQATIHEAVRLLLRAAPPGSQVILFGSHARGDARPDSDLDFLVVEPLVGDRNQEIVRLRDVIRPLRVRADVLVVSANVFDEWHDTPNNVFYEAAKEGKVFHEVG